MIDEVGFLGDAEEMKMIILNHRNTAGGLTLKPGFTNTKKG